MSYGTSICKGKRILCLLAEIFPICRPSDPPHFKNLMEDYVNRCSGAINIDKISISI